MTMPKLTVKYRSALAVAQVEGLKETGEALYEALAKRQYFWDSAEGEWRCADIADADPPTPLVRLRVWSDAELVEDAADDIVRVLVETYGYTLVEQSKAYPCRPPKQLEARVYLSFNPPAKKRKGA